MVSCATLLVSALRIKRKYYFLIDLHKRSARSRFLFLIHILDVKTVRIVPYQKTYHQFINIKIYRSEAEMPIKRSPVYLCDENVFQLSSDFICRPSLQFYINAAPESINLPREKRNVQKNTQFHNF